MERKEAGSSTTVSKDVSITKRPAPNLSIFDVIAVTVGIVIGAGIFRTPSVVAANSADNFTFLSVWIIGGLVSIAGALCYGELATTFPDTGGDYHFLRRAFGEKLAFLFVWARMSVIQTGSLALLAYIVGDYATQIYPLGDYSSTFYAGSVVVVLTSINILGIQFGTLVQKLLLGLEILAIFAIIFSGFFMYESDPVSIGSPSAITAGPMGLALIFVLLTFGGWNEAAYVSAELRSGTRRMAAALIWSLLIITTIYFLFNLAYLKVLGLENMANTDAVGAELGHAIYGKKGALIISIVVILSALTSANATIFTGARTNYALGRDFQSFRFMGRWNAKTSSPVQALLVQGIISLFIVGLGLVTRNGFETMIDYTAPVFWFFLFMVGLSLFVLRKKEPDSNRPFRVPLYPLTPIIFCLSTAYLLYSSIAYTGFGAMVGIAVIGIGVLVLLFMPQSNKK
jgi:amino acid transporter